MDTVVRGSHILHVIAHKRGRCVVCETCESLVRLDTKRPETWIGIHLVDAAAGPADALELGR